MLAALGVVVEVAAPPPGVEGRWTGGDPAVYVRQQALAKAEAVARARPPGVREDVLAADTIVVLDDAVLEKPQDALDAAAMLRRLSGRIHHVLTAVALVTTGSPDVAAQVELEYTAVTFADLEEDEIANYVATGEPLDKAGAYGVQGHAGVFVRRVEGCYYNVVGLPLPRVYAMLRARCTQGGA